VIQIDHTNKNPVMASRKINGKELRIYLFRAVIRLCGHIWVRKKKSRGCEIAPMVGAMH